MTIGTDPYPAPTKVTIGLPVYNGENFLDQAVRSILAQSYTDFTLIISDNASNDRTAEICRRHAAADRRVVYYRQNENIGAAPNFNFVFKMSRSPYFRWAAHDDVVGPDFLRACVERLDADPSLVLVHPLVTEINDAGEIINVVDDNGLNADMSYSRRLRWVMWVAELTELYGLMRADMLRTTRLLGSFGGADRNLLAEILMRGRIGRVREYHFFRRDHAQTLSRTLQPKKHSARSERRWYDPRARLPIFLLWPERLRRYLITVLETPMPWSEKLACAGVLVERSLRRGIHRLSGRRVLKGKPEFPVHGTGGPEKPRPPAVTRPERSGEGGAPPRGPLGSLSAMSLPESPG